MEENCAFGKTRERYREQKGLTLCSTVQREYHCKLQMFSRLSTFTHTCAHMHTYAYMHTQTSASCLGPSPPFNLPWYSQLSYEAHFSDTGSSSPMALGSSPNSIIANESAWLLCHEIWRWEGVGFEARSEAFQLPCDHCEGACMNVELNRADWECLSFPLTPTGVMPRRITPVL